jgi:hypothetical protein
MTKFLDTFMQWVYSSSLSIMDIWVIMIIGELGTQFSMWIWVLIIPWCIYSAKQKLKYDEQ